MQIGAETLARVLVASRRHQCAVLGHAANAGGVEEEGVVDLPLASDSGSNVTGARTRAAQLRQVDFRCSRMLVLAR